MVDYFEGVLQIANVFLSVVAGLIAISLFHFSMRRNELKPWNYLIVVLVLFAVEEIIGALRSFQIYESAYLTHVIPSIMLGLLIYALVLEISVAREAA